MSGPEAKNPAPAGISSSEIDVADLFERLREELRRGAVHGDARGADFAATRALAERFWPVTAEREAGGGPKGLVKRVLRKFMRWYVEPLAADQRVYNDSVLKLVDALSERADSSTAARHELERLVRELEERLARLERRGERVGDGVAAPITVAGPGASRGWRRASWPRSRAPCAAGPSRPASRLPSGRCRASPWSSSA